MDHGSREPVAGSQPRIARTSAALQKAGRKDEARKPFQRISDLPSASSKNNRQGVHAQLLLRVGEEAEEVAR